jgi:hypothetical protein
MGGAVGVGGTGAGGGPSGLVGVSQVYELRTGASGRCLQDAGGLLVQGDCAHAMSHWSFSQDSSGNVEIRNADTDRAMSPPAAAGPITLVTAPSFTLSTHLATLDTLVLRPKHSVQAGMCVDVAGGSVVDHASLQQYPCTGAANQRWQLVPAASDSALISDSAGAPFLLKARGTNECLDLIDGTSTLQTYACNGGDNQLFRLFTIADGRWSLKAVHNGQCVEIANASMAAHASLRTATCSGADNQRFGLDGWTTRTVRVTADSGAAMPTPAVAAAAVDVANRTYVGAGLALSGLVSGTGTSADFTGHVSASCGDGTGAWQALTLRSGACPSACAAGRDTWDVHLAHELGHALGLTHPFSGATDASFCAGADGDGDRWVDTPPMTSDEVLPSSCTSAADFVCPSPSTLRFPTTYAMGNAYALRADGGRDLSPAQRLAVRAGLYARGFDM